VHPYADSAQKRKPNRGLTLAGAIVALAGTLGAAERSSIPFADIGNIRNWHAASAEDLYIQAMNRDWYRVTFWSPCQALPFAVGIAFVTEANGQLDSFSSILVDGERCWFKTFEPSGPPPAEDAR
jgi:hypothetical protein